MRLYLDGEYYADCINKFDYYKRLKSGTENNNLLTKEAKTYPYTKEIANNIVKYISLKN